MIVQEKYKIQCYIWLGLRLWLLIIMRTEPPRIHDVQVSRGLHYWRSKFIRVQILGFRWTRTVWIVVKAAISCMQIADGLMRSRHTILHRPSSTSLLVIVSGLTESPLSPEKHLSLSINVDCIALIAEEDNVNRRRRLYYTVWDFVVLYCECADNTSRRNYERPTLLLICKQTVVEVC